jgi:putative transcriptional regulator
MLRVASRLRGALLGGLLLAASCTPASSLRAVTPRPTSLAPGVFLVAARTLGDPNFAATVVLLIEYNPHGALGLVINRPTRFGIGEAIPELEGSAGSEGPVYFGGPVLPHRLLFAIGGESRPEGMQRVIEGVHVGGRLEALRAALGASASEARVYSGHSGWGPGQLDAEIARHDWYVVTADAGSVFSAAPDDLWPRLISVGEAIWAHASPP